MPSPQPFFFSLYEPLPPTTTIHGKEYKTKEIINSIEQITGQRITKLNGRLVKQFHNVTLEFFIIKPERIGEPLRIVSKKGFIEVW